MATFDVYNLQKQKVGTIDLSDAVFAAEVNEHLIYEVAKMQQINRRAGTVAVKNRSLVSGGGKKPWKQKGTGRARQGTTRAPHWRHGGVVFGPHPRDYRKVLPRKMRRLAIASAFSARVADGDVVVVDQVNVEEISTKRMAEFLNRLELSGKVLMILGAQDVNVWKSVRNIPGVKLAVAPNVSTYELLWADKIVLDKAGAGMFPAGGEQAQ